MKPLGIFLSLAIIIAVGCGGPAHDHQDVADITENKGEPGAFLVTSPAFQHGGMLPKEFSGDGEGISPPIEWTGVPVGTRSLALTLWHVPGKGSEKSYWIVYDIPPDAAGLPKGSKGIGKTGYNDKNRAEYDPMKSKGPGVKVYNLTVYALSARPVFASDKVTRTELLAAIKDIKLAENTLTWKYERQVTKP